MKREVTDYYEAGGNPESDGGVVGEKGLSIMAGVWRR